MGAASLDRWRASETSLTPSPEKIREAIIFVIRKADREGFVATQYDILKTLFFADRSHLNEYGRPITFDQYHALKDGPVPSFSYDILKGDRQALALAGLEGPLWSERPLRNTIRAFFNAARDASEDVLSESDEEELSKALDLVRQLGFAGVWAKTHEDPAWEEAWESRGTMNRAPMDYVRLLEKADAPKRIKELAFASSLM